MQFIDEDYVYLVLDLNFAPNMVALIEIFAV